MGCTESTPVNASLNRPVDDAVKARQVLPSPSSTTGAATRSTKSSKDSTATTTPEGDDDDDHDDDDGPVDPEAAAVTKIQSFVRGTLCRIQVGLMVQSLIDDLIHQQQKIVFDALDAAEAEDQGYKQEETAHVTASAADVEDLQDEQQQNQQDDEESLSSPHGPPPQQDVEEEKGHECVDINDEDVVESDLNSKQQTESDEIIDVVKEQHAREEEGGGEGGLLPPVKQQSLSYVHPDDQPAETERANDGRLPLWWMDHVPHKINFDGDGGENASIVVTTGTDFAAARSLFS